MTDKKTKYEQIAAFFTEDDDIHFPVWLVNAYNLLLNSAFLIIWLLFFGYLFKQVDGAYIGVFRSAASYGRNNYIYMAVHYALLFIYLWIAWRFYRHYFLCPRNLWHKTFILIASVFLFIPAFTLAYIDVYFVRLRRWFSAVWAKLEAIIRAFATFVTYLHSLLLPKFSRKYRKKSE